MRIWLINHYGVPPKYYPLARPTLFAKYLKKMGHEVIIFASSAVHNSDINLIEDRVLYRKDRVEGVNYVYIRCRQYKGNGKKRIVNLLEFAGRLSKVCSHFKKPDVIVSTSFDPISCYCGIRLAKKYKAKAIAEIADLWPETPVAYGMVKASSPIVKGLRVLEKKIYTTANAIIFTMEGAYQYIEERGWTKEIPRNKVFYINNGVDLEEFERNCKEYVINDQDLLAENKIKIVYTGAIRKVNNLGLLLDAAKLVKNSNVIFLIWGDGDELEQLESRVKLECINNVKFKGRADKKFIPYITRHADINFSHGEHSPIAKYGLSMNKTFDYLAAGKPILTDVLSPYSPIVQCGAALEIENPTAENIAKAVDEMVNLGTDKLEELGSNASKGAKQYDFKSLTKQLETIINNI